jgi:hypothetical protein
LNDLKQKDWPRRISDKIDVFSVLLLHSDFEKAAAMAAEEIAALSPAWNTVKNGDDG